MRNVRSRYRGAEVVQLETPTAKTFAKIGPRQVHLTSITGVSGHDQLCVMCAKYNSAVPRRPSMLNVCGLGCRRRLVGNVVVVLTLIRTIKSVVTGQVPVPLDLRKYPREKTQTNQRWYTHSLYRLYISQQT